MLQKIQLKWDPLVFGALQYTMLIFRFPSLHMFMWYIGKDDVTIIYNYKHLIIHSTPPIMKSLLTKIAFNKGKPLHQIHAIHL